MASPTIPGYKNLSQIGSGGFSRVYQGEQAKLKRTVAVKVLNFGLSDEADRRSFERECELMGRVSTHPNIVTVHNTEFTTEGQPCIVMEHYPGGSLADLIGDIGRLTEHDALEVGVAIASALEASHQAGVLHCDLKPQNILISEFGQPALGDFGISTFTEERTHTGTDAGAGFTLAYAAPEILEGASPAVTSDVYSLAATLYTALAGRRPFFHPNADGERPIPSEQARRILLDTAPSLVELGVSPQLDELIANAMSKEAEHRPTTAASFAFALYEVGRVLGLGTSSPRIAEGAGLLGRVGEDDDQASQTGETEPSAPAIDLTQLRTQARVSAPPVLEDAPVAPVQQAAADKAGQAWPEVAPTVPRQPAPSSQRAPSRQLRSVGFVLASLVVVAAVLFFVVDRGDDPQVGDDVAATSAPVAAAVNPVIAPNKPTNVSLVPLDSNRAVVLWTVPGGVDPTGDVSYEVRWQGNSAAPLVTTNSMLVIDYVSSSTANCVTVLAVRSNRTSTATSPVCLDSTPGVFVDLTSSSCPAADCMVGFSIKGGGDAVAVTVLDETNSAIDAVIQDASNGDPGAITLPTETAAGQYLVLVVADGLRSGTILTVE